MDELVKALHETADWIVALATESRFAHDELNALHHEDTVRDAADAIEKLMAEAKERMVTPNGSLRNMYGEDVDYEQVIDDLRHELTDDFALHDEGANALEMLLEQAAEYKRNWKFCDRMLKIAIRATGISMTALVKLAEIEEEYDDERPSGT